MKGLNVYPNLGGLGVLKGAVNQYDMTAYGNILKGQPLRLNRDGNVCAHTNIYGSPTISPLVQNVGGLVPMSSTHVIMAPYTLYNPGGDIWHIYSVAYAGEYNPSTGGVNFGAPATFSSGDAPLLGAMTSFVSTGGVRKIFLLYAHVNANAGYKCRILTVSGNTITLGTEYDLGLGAESVAGNYFLDGCQVIPIDTDKVAINIGRRVSGGSPARYLLVCSMSGNVITVGQIYERSTHFTWVGGTHTPCGIHYLSPNKILISYLSNSSGVACSRVANVSGTTISFHNTEYATPVNPTAWNTTSCFVSNNKLILSNSLSLFTATESSNVVSYGPTIASSLELTNSSMINSSTVQTNSPSVRVVIGGGDALSVDTNAIMSGLAPNFRFLGSNSNHWYFHSNGNIVFGCADDVMGRNVGCATANASTGNVCTVQSLGLIGDIPIGSLPWISPLAYYGPALGAGLMQTSTGWQIYCVNPKTIYVRAPWHT